MKRFTAGRWMLGGLAMAIVATAGAQISKQGNGYLFRMKFTKGQSIQYMSQTDTSPMGTPMKISMSMGMKTLDVSNGVGTVRVEMGAMQMNGKPFAMGASQMPKQITVKMDGRGQVQGQASGVNTGSITFPAGPIQVGGGWEGSTEAQTGMGAGMSVQTKYKFVGIENVGGTQVAKVAITLKGTGKANISGSGYALFSLKDGSTIKNVTTVNISFGTKSIPMVTTISRK